MCQGDKGSSRLSRLRLSVKSVKTETFRYAHANNHASWTVGSSQELVSAEEKTTTTTNDGLRHLRLFDQRRLSVVYSERNRLRDGLSKRVVLRGDRFDLLLRRTRRRGAQEAGLHDCARYVYFGLPFAIATRSSLTSKPIGDAATRLEDSSLDSLGVRSFCLGII